MISTDLETRSAVDLITQGSWLYATDPSTEIISMAYAVDYGEPELWLPGDPVPECFLEDTTVHAFNADGFERLIWDFIMTPDHGFPQVELEQWRCTAFKCRTNNLPGKLDLAARCLNVVQQKDSRGMELIKRLCIPLADGTFDNDPALLEEMYAYNLQDVRAEMDVDKLLREPTAEEWADFHANARINERGVRIDYDLCVAAQQYAKEEEADLIDRIAEVTDDAVQKTRGEKLKAWVVERLTPEQEKLLVKYRDGERKLSLDKYNRARLLALDDIDADVREVVECSDFAQRSSVGKFAAMERLADPEDQRVRGALMCNGASQSGRYSSRGLQVHNFPRIVMPDPMEVRADFIDSIHSEDITDYFKQPIMAILSHMLRPALVPAPGNVFLVSDWSAIEGRVAPWLCDNVLADAKVEMYADDAPVYEITAAGTFRVDVEDVTKDQRQVGKVQELAFQFGGGKGAFLAMARNYGLSVTDAEADKYKEAWRRQNPWAQAMWADIERAAKLAISNPEQLFDVGRLTYFAVEDVLCGGTTLFCQLPDRRLLTYPDVRLEEVETPWGEMRPTLTALRAAFIPKASEKEWPRTSLWGGEMFNNAVQGTAGSLLRHVLRTTSLPVVMHVHDEVVAEVQEEAIEEAADELHADMNTPPDWADGLPLKADVDVMRRFGK